MPLGKKPLNPGTKTKQTRLAKWLIRGAVGLLGLLAVWVAALVGAVFTIGFSPRPYLNAKPQDAPFDFVPASATNVDYVLHGLFGPVDYLAFNVSEKKFRQIAKKQHWKVHELRFSPELVHRPKGMRSGSRSRFVLVKKGLEYEHYVGDRGFHVWFDSARSRVYYERDFR